MLRKIFFIFFLASTPFLTPSVQPVLAADGMVYIYKDPSERNPDTTISVTPGYVMFTSRPGEMMIADLERRDLFVEDPGRGLISLKTMRAQLFPNGVPAGAQNPAQSLDLADVDGDLAVMFEGIPAPVQNQLKSTFAKIPRAQAIPMINQMRAQFGLPPVDPGVGVPSGAAQPAGPERIETGQRSKINGFDVREIALSGDMIWITDPSKIDGGPAFVEQMGAFGRVFEEVAAGLPIPDSSLFKFDKLGGFPILVTSQGEQFMFSHASRGTVQVPVLP